MRITKNVNFDMKEVINSESVILTVKDFGGQSLVLSGILIGEKDEDGATKIVAVMKTDKGLISSISPTIINGLETLISAYTDFNQLDVLTAGIKVTVTANKSASKGREFFTLIAE